MSSKIPVWLGLILLLLFTCWGISDCLNLPTQESQAGQVLQESKREPRLYQGGISYGEPLAWEEANKLFPKYTTALLTDLETGKQFEVERRGGTFHADIQPVTAADTMVLKEIYGGEWSWQRRAVVAQISLSRLAASINGMPHGSGKISNNFPGHFCIHFLGCRVHLSGKVDPAHQMMVWKAAGYPEKLFMEAEPPELINLVLTALNQEDVALAALGLYCPEGEDLWLATEALQGRLPVIALKKLQAVIPKDKEEQGQEEVAEGREKQKQNGKPAPDGPAPAGQELILKKYAVTLILRYPHEKGEREKKGEITVIKKPVKKDEPAEEQGEVRSESRLEKRIETGSERWVMVGTGLKELLEMVD
jgi:hypothetical protein